MVSPEKINEIKSRFEIVGNSPQLLRGLEIAAKVAPTDLTVLILGESGVGKENISKIIHHLSRRKHNGFIAINCGAIPEGTIDSELFGHEKGAFTSAHEARKGYFETVDGGTIFLDEIGELPLETQSRLLRVLESGEFIKVGSSKVQKTDVRVVAATNKDLLEQVDKGKFREDLYYRLSSVTIKIPPLRERTNDIGLLFAKFASDIADKYRVPPLELTHEALEVIKAFPWPGNIRQLKNFVEQISILETERVLYPATLEKYLPDAPRTQMTFAGMSGEGGFGSGAGSYQERELLYKVLFDMRRDISELRAYILELLHNTTGLTATPQPAGPVNAMSTAARLLPPVQSYPAHPSVSPVYETHHEHEGEAYEVHEVERPSDEVLSLQEKEKEMIRKALYRHHGKRKSAAQELGISERTLYRKIKEYNLEDLQ